MDLNASDILLCLRYGIGDLIMELPLLGTPCIQAIDPARVYTAV